MSILRYPYLIGNSPDTYTYICEDVYIGIMYVYMQIYLYMYIYDCMYVYIYILYIYVCIYTWYYISHVAQRCATLCALLLQVYRGPAISEAMAPSQPARGARSSTWSGHRPHSAQQYMARTWIKCRHNNHKSAMTGNGEHTNYLCWWLADGLWNSYTHMSDLGPS